jgi:hypothetical protein
MSEAERNINEVTSPNFYTKLHQIQKRVKEAMGVLEGPLEGILKKENNIKNKACHLEPLAKSTLFQRL